LRNLHGLTLSDLSGLRKTVTALPAAPEAGRPAAVTALDSPYQGWGRRRIADMLRNATAGETPEPAAQRFERTASGLRANRDPTHP